MKNIKYIDGAEIKNKRVLVRTDFNVPLRPDGSIADDSRIRETVPTLKYLLERKNKVIIASHLGRPSERNEHDSLLKAAHRLHVYLPEYHWHFIPDFVKDKHILDGQKQGEFAVLENLRFYDGEAANDEDFAQKLASIADVYVNDAFAVSHRNAASVIAITEHLPSYAGLLMKKEIEMLKKVSDNPKSPYVAIIGGKKISTKLKFLSKLLRVSDYVLLAGGLANTFFAARGYQVGKSLFRKEELGQVNTLTSLARRHGTKIVLPEDVVVGPDKDGDKSQIKLLNQLTGSDQILDIGPKTQALFESIIIKAKTIVWNGPLGYFENPLFRRGTDFVYYAIEQNPSALSVVGGGDTIAAIAGRENLDKITHISTGGGAMLAFIEHGTLPAIEALK